MKKRKPLSLVKTKPSSRTATATKERPRLPWDPDSAEVTYPLNEWFIPSTDAAGHDARIVFRVPPAYKGQIAKIIQKRVYPWSTESDLVRIALHRFLAQITKDLKDPDVTSQQAILNSLTEVASRQMEYAHFKDTLTFLRTTVDELIRAKAFPMAKKMIDSVEEQVKDFEEDFWRDRYSKDLVEVGKLLIKEQDK